MLRIPFRPVTLKIKWLNSLPLLARTGHKKLYVLITIDAVLYAFVLLYYIGMLQFGY